MRDERWIIKRLVELNSELEQLIEAKKQALKEGRTDNYETHYTMEAEQIGKITALEEVLIVEG